MNEETLKKVAELARLALSPDETKKFALQLGEVLKYVEKLNALDTKGIEPLTTPLEIETPLRADEARPSPGPAVIVGCAPDSVYDSFKVPQVIGGA